MVRKFPSGFNVSSTQSISLSHSSNEEIANMIQKGDRSRFDAGILKQLLKLLPESHEINKLKSCKEERSELANADQFYLHLLEVPSYQLRIECMLICEETQILLQCLWPKAQAIRTACESKCIRDVSMASAQSREASLLFLILML
eukprot:XP_025007065.1 inverted formin-2-like [Gallus gallus]